MDFRSSLKSVAALVVDQTYSGGRNGNSSDDPLHPLLGVSNQGGFRIIGEKSAPRLIVITSSYRDLDWPDHLDKENGLYTYFGDNKKPGNELHDTPRYGNLLLRDIFDKSHGSEQDRLQVPPILVFANSGKYRDVQFFGLAVPGGQALGSNNDLVALWRQKSGKRFQNYQAKFTILNEPTVCRQWIEDIKAGNPLSKNCPDAWRKWVKNRTYKALKAPRTIEYRNKAEQVPIDESDRLLIEIIQKYFRRHPIRFEGCAAKLAEIMLKNIVSIDLTRPVRDGGRDASGKYRIGNGAASVLVDFALEAKCYSFKNSVGVKDLSRLISRLKHRQFGILVTTSYVALQAYKEIKEDDHPIIIVSAVDIVQILKHAGLATDESIKSWLNSF